MNKLLHPFQSRRLKKAREAHRFTPTADDLTRWAAEDERYYNALAERWLSDELSC